MEALKIKRLLEFVNAPDLSTPESIAKALLVIKHNKKLLAEIEKKVKEKATESLEDEGVRCLSYSITDPDTGEVQKWEIRQVEASMIEEYNPVSVVETLGIKEAGEFIKVTTGKLKKHLDKLSYEAETSKDWKKKDTEAVVAKMSGCGKNSIEKPRKGYVLLREVK